MPLKRKGSIAPKIQKTDQRGEAERQESNNAQIKYYRFAKN